MKVKDVMSSKVQVIPPETTISKAAELMRDLNIGALPVAKKNGIMGIITDRDIVIRADAQHWDPDNHTVQEVMSKSVECCLDTENLENIVDKMESKQIRRLPVLDKDKKLIGMLSLGDISQKTSNQLSGEVLKAISHP